MTIKDTSLTLVDQNFIDLDDRVEALAVAGLPEYYFAKDSGVVVTGTNAGSATKVVELITPVLPAGTYHLGYSFQITFGAKGNEAFFKLDGTFPDTDYFTDIASDNALSALHRNRLYAYPKVFAGGVATLQLMMYMSGGVSLTADFADLFIQRVA